MSSKEDFYANLPSFTSNLFKTENRPVKKPVVKPKPKPAPKIADLKPRSPMMKKFMKAKELDTKINLLRKAGKSPRDFVDLLDEFQKISVDLEEDL